MATAEYEQLDEKFRTMTRWEMAEIIKGKDEEIEDHKYALGEWRKIIDHQKSEIAKFQQEVIDLK